MKFQAANIHDNADLQKQNSEPISKLSKNVTPAKAGVQKRIENTGFRPSPE
jgi:hypothetical protein